MDQGDHAMLSELFGQLSRENNNPLVENAFKEMGQAIQLLQKEMNRYEDPTHDLRKLEIWTRGLVSSLTELDESYAAAEFFRKSITIAGFMDDMSAKEQLDYARYVYFYKNGFIRVFAVLDKLGTFLNEVYDLETSKVKSQYSYFTVLRQFSDKHTHQSLGRKLEAIREEYRQPINDIRKRRNAEIHYMNVEMEDDLWQRHQGLHDKIILEDVDKHLLELKLGVDMVSRTLSTVYLYTSERWIRKDIQT